MTYSVDVQRLFMQVEIYDQYCFVRELPKDSKHSTTVIELVKDFIDRLENIQDIDSEYFPFRLIGELKQEYLGLEE